MLKLTNEYLTAAFLEKGAELISLKDSKGTEYLMRDERYWGYTAPHLFPVVGMLKDGILRHEGQDYPQKRHGFARTMVFTVVSHEEERLVFELTSDESTRKHFPFDFVFKVIYTLKNASLCITYEVENRSGTLLPFSVGAHPAFLVPVHDQESFKEYTLVFEKEEHLERIPIDTTTGLLKRSRTVFMENTTIIPLSKDLFKEDALIFQHLNSSYVTLMSHGSGSSVRFHFKDFPFLGIWTTEDEAPFLCLEPWAGHADYEDFQGDYLDKEDNVLLQAGASESFSYTIEIL